MITKIEKELGELAEAVFDLKKKKKSTLEICLISDKKMQEINLRYRGKDKPTNILTFIEPCVPHPETKKEFLGVVYLAPSYIKSKKENIKELLIHGLLHLLGYDHESKNDRIVMEKEEERLISKLLSKKVVI